MNKNLKLCILYRGELNRKGSQGSEEQTNDLTEQYEAFRNSNIYINNKMYFNNLFQVEIPAFWQWHLPVRWRRCGLQAPAQVQPSGCLHATELFEHTWSLSRLKRLVSARPRCFVSRVVWWSKIQHPTATVDKVLFWCVSFLQNVNYQIPGS